MSNQFLYLPAHVVFSFSVMACRLPSLMIARILSNAFLSLVVKSALVGYLADSLLSNSLCSALKSTITKTFISGAGVDMLDGPISSRIIGGSPEFGITTGEPDGRIGVVIFTPV